MKPPICEVCLRRLSDHTEGDNRGGLVRFDDYQALPTGMVGHPKGLGWFCAQHHGQALLLKGHAMRQAVQLIKATL